MTQAIWKRPITLEALNHQNQETIVSHLGIEFIEVGHDHLIARMPADRRTHQPMGIVHGGASVTLAETLGSVGANLCLDPEFAAVGLDINANHLRPVRTGWVTGRARPVHLGRTTQVWQIDMHDDQGRPTCISRLTMAVIPGRPRGD